MPTVARSFMPPITGPRVSCPLLFMVFALLLLSAASAQRLVSLQSDIGRCITLCSGCQRTATPDLNTAMLHGDANTPYSTLEMAQLPNGNVTFKCIADNMYLAACSGCIVGGEKPDFLTFHVADPRDAPWAQFRVDRLRNGKFTIQCVHNGKYISRCEGCSPGASYNQQVTAHLSDPNEGPYAQWEILDVAPARVPGNISPAQTWSMKNGAAYDIAVGAEGSVWIVGINEAPGGYGIYTWAGNNWVNIDGGAVHIAVDSRGVPWVVNSEGVIYRREGNAWKQLEGAATDIGAGADGSVWIVGTNPVGGGYGICKWTGAGWQSIDGGAVRIAVDNRGEPWVINDAGSIAKREGMRWRQLSGVAQDIGIGADGSVWVVGPNAVLGGFGIYKRLGADWRAVDGGATNIAVGPNGLPWIINNGFSIFERLRF